MHGIILRFANVYGERQGETGEGGVISIFARLLHEHKPLPFLATVSRPGTYLCR